jgi:serine phosphatase RsbU (regulator of sigma subunit)/anti-sigma regulatory factor (Ser/Thr protein kinase)
MAETSIQPSRSTSLRLSLPCDLARVRPASMAVTRFLREQRAGEEIIQACEIALVEALNNAIAYASASGRLSPVEIEASCLESRIEMRVFDHTGGFELPRNFELPPPESEQGRGLYLIHAVMDTVDYLQGREVNCLFMGKLCSHRGELHPPEELREKLGESEQIITDMAEELSFCYESLSAIFRCSADLGRTNDIAEFSQRLLTDLSQITSADWFVLRLVGREGRFLEVFAASDPALKLAPLDLRGGGHSVELEAAEKRQDFWFDHHRPLEPNDPLGLIKKESTGLVHPIFMGEELIGTIAVGKDYPVTPFTAVHANVVHTFSDFLAIEMVNARLQEEKVQAKLVSRELEIARNIQRSLLPKALPSVEGFRLAGFCQSARRVGGDFYDVIKLEDGSLLLVIADVMGKGIPAAMFASILRSLVRAVPELSQKPEVLLERINRLLFEELSGVDMFITAQLAHVDMGGGKLVLASAGHCPLLLGRGKEVRAISPEGLPLGIMAETAFSVHAEPLDAATCLLLYTDGLTEARNPEGEFFGQERLARWFQERMQQPASAEELKGELSRMLEEFQGGALSNDDQTFLIMAKGETIL